MELRFNNFFLIAAIFIFTAVAIQMNARYYNPDTGRFITADLATQSFDAQGLNRYAYCDNNPIKYIDPTGHTTENRGTGVTNESFMTYLQKHSKFAETPQREPYTTTRGYGEFFLGAFKLAEGLTLSLDAKDPLGFFWKGYGLSTIGKMTYFYGAFPELPGGEEMSILGQFLKVASCYQTFQTTEDKGLFGVNQAGGILYRLIRHKSERRFFNMLKPITGTAMTFYSIYNNFQNFQNAWQNAVNDTSWTSDAYFNHIGALLGYGGLEVGYLASSIAIAYGFMGKGVQKKAIVDGEEVLMTIPWLRRAGSTGNLIGVIGNAGVLASQGFKFSKDYIKSHNETGHGVDSLWNYVLDHAEVKF